MAVTTDRDLKTDSADILAAEQKEEEEKMAPVSNVDQPAAVTSVSSITGSENISLFIGQFPIRIPSYSEETKTNDQEMNNNVELDLEKDTQGTVMCSTLPVEEINNIINTKEEEEKMAPVSNVDQPAAVTSVSSITGSENISLFIGQFPIRIPSYSEETKTNDQEMNNNVELDLEKDTQGTVMCSTLPVEEINNIINTILETNQFADVMNIKGIPLVSEANSTVDQAKSNDDEKSEARGNEVIREEEQEELNADAIVLGTTTTTVTTSVPLQEGNNINYVPEANQFADLMNTKESLVVSEAKTTMDQAKNSNDAKDKFEVRKKLTKAKQNASKAEATKKTENQAQKQKAKAIRIEGYNEFSLLEELENEQELDIEAKRVEEAATTTEEKPHENEFDAESSSEKEQDIEAKRVKEAATIVAVATASTSEEKAHKSESDAQSGSEKEQDVDAKRVEEDAAAKKKREKRKRKKKSKAEKLNGSFPSVGVFSLALVCLLIYSFL